MNLIDTDDMMTKNIIKAVILLCGLAACIFGFNWIMYKLTGLSTATTDIISVEGRAYIEVDGLVTRLVDSDGEQVMYNNTVKQNHNLQTSTVTVGGNRVYLVYDKDTGMYYLGIGEQTSEEVARTVNIMYNKEVIE